MREIAVRVDQLGKRYRIGPRQPYGTLRDTLTTLMVAPIRRLRHHAHGNGHEPSSIWALRNVSLEVARGEVLGIIGRNGAGKTTLLRILSRITEPTEGSVELRGRVGTLLEVGTGFHPELTGRENVFLNGAILGMKRSDIVRRFDAIVAFAEVDRFLDTPVKHYSSGMRVRLAFAVAAHLNPEILLVDEVLAVGDAAFQKKCFGKMEEVSKSGRTIVVVSHNMPTICNLCDRAVLLDRGGVVASGAPREIVQRYLASAGSRGGEMLWDDRDTAPGGDLVRLLAVRIGQEGQPFPTAEVEISKEILIEITFENRRDGLPLYTAVWLRDEVGTCVLASGNLRSISSTLDPWGGRTYPIGVYRSVCRLPADFLNEGRYSVTPIVGRGVSDTQAIQEDAVTFHVHDTGDMRKEYLGAWAGIVRPRLAWSTEKLA